MLYSELRNVRRWGATMATGLGGIAFDRANGGLAFVLPNKVPVLVHWSFLIPAAILSQPLWSRGAFIQALLFAVILLASIFLHEIGHMIAAHRRGVSSQAILIHLLGGVVFLRIDEERKFPAAQIALAGPMVNVALGVIFLAINALMPAPPSKVYFGHVVILGGPLPLPRLAYVAGVLNLGLAAVNLIPAFDLDGGVIAREGLARYVGRRSANLFVGLSGLAFATLASVVFVASALGGWPIWAPPSYLPNWTAVRENWRRGP